MKEKIKLGIPIENEETGETNIILRTNEIRIIEEAFEETERLNNIINEVREYVKDTPKIVKSMYFNQKRFKDDLPAILVFLEKTFKNEMLEILDKVSDKE